MGQLGASIGVDPKGMGDIPQIFDQWEAMAYNHPPMLCIGENILIYL